jgi:hypothetical protein
MDIMNENWFKKLTSNEYDIATMRGIYEATPL